jgi:hypothetical protein
MNIIIIFLPHFHNRDFRKPFFVLFICVNQFYDNI